MKFKEYISKFLSVSLIFTSLFQCLSKAEEVDNKITCAICLEERDKEKDKAILTELICGHQFCTACINKWKGQKRNVKCPLCRGKIEEKNNNNLNNEEKNNNNLNNNDDYDQWSRDFEERCARDRQRWDELQEKWRKEDEEYQARRDKYDAPTGEDGMTKYEREYYKENYKKILDDGLQEISNAKNKEEITQIKWDTCDKITKLIYKAPTYELGLHFEHMTDYTRRMLTNACEKRWNEIKPLIPPEAAIPISAALVVVAGEAHGYWKQKYSENYSQDADFDNNIYNVNPMDDDDLASINNILDISKDTDNSIQDIIDVLD